jgi:DNA-binding MarR family transcriptional regulator
MPVHAALRASVPTVRTGYGPVRRSDLGRWLAFDSSALTRNLRVLLDNKWLEAVPDSKDGRGLPLQVTKAGASLLRALGPAWHKAQGRALAMVGGEGRAAVIGLFDKVQAAMAA